MPFQCVNCGELCIDENSKCKCDEELENYSNWEEYLLDKTKEGFFERLEEGYTKEALLEEIELLSNEVERLNRIIDAILEKR